MSIDLVFITYNRLDYTKKSLASVLADPTEKFNLYIWDNASEDGTQEYLKNEVSDPRIQDIMLSKENVGQVAAVNKIWGNSKADLLGKLDNDCLVTPGWTRTLARAHEDIEQLGVIACWHFFKDDFDYELAKHKIQTFGNHQILRHPWTCGTGLLIKRDTYEKFGPIKDKATTSYWLEMAMSGYINGFYYPLIYQEHMDDTMSEHSKLTDDKAIQEMRPATFSLKYHDVNNLQQRVALREKCINNLLADPWQAKYYVGWRKKLRRIKQIVFGK